MNVFVAVVAVHPRRGAVLERVLKLRRERKDIALNPLGSDVAHVMMIMTMMKIILSFYRVIDVVFV